MEIDDKLSSLDMKFRSRIEDGEDLQKAALEAQGEKSAAARARKKAVVAPLSNKMGVVVPYDKATELGYRQLHCTGAALRKLLAQIESSSGEERVAKQACLTRTLALALTLTLSLALTRTLTVTLTPTPTPTPTLTLT